MATPVLASSLGVTDCYRNLNNSVALSTYNDGICPGSKSASGHYQCCAMRDKCMADNFCYSTYAFAGSSGFYTTGCNDPTWQDTAACTPRCVEELRPDVVYDGTTGLWACCGSMDETSNCSAPTAVTFYAPSAQEILATSSESDSTNSSDTTNSTASTLLPSSSSAVSSTSSTSQPSVVSNSSNSHSSFPTGAIAGIAIGVVVLVAVVIAALWFMRRKRRGMSQAQDQGHHAKASTPATEMYQSPDPKHIQEADGNSALPRYRIKGNSSVNPTELST